MTMSHDRASGIPHTVSLTWFVTLGRGGGSTLGIWNFKFTMASS